MIYVGNEIKIITHTFAGDINCATSFVFSCSSKLLHEWTPRV